MEPLAGLIAGVAAGFMWALYSLRKPRARGLPTSEQRRTRTLAVAQSRPTPGLDIEGTLPALVSREDLIQHGLDPRHFLDARFVPGPCPYHSLSAAVRFHLSKAVSDGRCRGLNVSQLFALRRRIGEGEGLVFVLLRAPVEGMRVFVYLGTAPDISTRKV